VRYPQGVKKKRTRLKKGRKSVTGKLAESGEGQSKKYKKGTTPKRPTNQEAVCDGPDRQQQK